jgi:hypothetical protein
MDDDESAMFIDASRIEKYKLRLEAEKKRKWEDFYKKAKDTLDNLDSFKSIFSFRFKTA